MKLNRSQLIKELDKLVSIRVRYGTAKQKRDGLHCVCISCLKEFPIGKIDCGHFVRRGVLPLRFDLRNVHPECQYDNRFNIDHLVGYTLHMQALYGNKEVDKLLQVKEDWLNGKIKPYTLVELKQLYNDNLLAVRKLEQEKNLKLYPHTKKVLDL